MLTCLPLILSSQLQLLPDNYHPAYFTWPDTLKPGRDYVDQTVIFKVKPVFRHNCFLQQINLPVFKAFKEKLGNVSLQKMHPTHQPPKTLHNRMGQKLADLSLVYVLHYDAEVPVLQIVNQIASSG